MSEFESPERSGREPTMADLRTLMGASTPHFALQLRNRIGLLIKPLDAGHPVRAAGEREIARLDEIARGGERRGPNDGRPPLPASTTRADSVG